MNRLSNIAILLIPLSFLFELGSWQWFLIMGLALLCLLSALIRVLSRRDARAGIMQFLRTSYLEDCLVWMGGAILWVIAGFIPCAILWGVFSICHLLIFSRKVIAKTQNKN